MLFIEGCNTIKECHVILLGMNYINGKIYNINIEDLPENVYDVIISFIPQDRDQKSPTAQIISMFINSYKEIERDPLWAGITFLDFVKDSEYFLEEEGTYREYNRGRIE